MGAVHKKADGEAEVLAKIAEMPAPYRALGARLHEIIMTSAPGLTPKVRYGLPWYLKDGKAWCFFRWAKPFDFMTFGFDDPALLAPQVGAAHQLVASAYRITTLDETTAAELAAIVCKAAGRGSCA